ncbi:MAG: aldehyde dehydrogenase family protein [Candidatus Sericytochromatia bacterium]|nr:aldehyde dehydrogenase family protein [Candidatus Tanganyikabacteria bacterium]
MTVTAPTSPARAVAWEPEGIRRELSAWHGLGRDPLAGLYAARRAAWDLFTPQLSDAEIEGLRQYLFPELPERPGDAPVVVQNLIDGVWCDPGKRALMPALFDRRVTLADVPDSQAADVEAVLSAADGFWASLAWADEVLTYRKWVVANVSRILDHFSEEVMAQIRHVIPKTRLESQKDFWEAKRAADHIGGNADRAMTGDWLPGQVPGHHYWRNPCLPAGIAVLITPMNFIYGIPMIQLVGAYLSGSPIVFKGHPYGAICNRTMARMFLAAGADPRGFHTLEGFGKGVGNLSSDPRVAVVSLTGGEATARAISAQRGLRTLRFEGGGCNWSWIDAGYSDAELEVIGTRLAYSKLGFSSHKCTTLHGIAADPATLAKVIGYVNAEMDRWEVRDPRQTQEIRVVGPNMVHKAVTVDRIQAAAEAAGLKVLRRGGKVSGDDYADHAEVLRPVILETRPDSMLTCDWDDKGDVTFNLATTEFFMPILCAMEMGEFEDFVRFSLLTNPHDLACSIWTRDDRKLQRARRILGGMLKENDGTDSALEWEEFGASGIGASGNMGVGEAQATLANFSRRQKGRHVTF